MVFLTSEHGKGWRIMPTPWNWQGKRWSITPTPWKWLRSRGREKMRHWGRELTRVDHCLAFYLHPCRGPSSRSFKIHTCRKIIFHLIKRFWDLNMSFSTWFLTLIWMCVCVCMLPDGICVHTSSSQYLASRYTKKFEEAVLLITIASLC